MCLSHHKFRGGGGEEEEEEEEGDKCHSHKRECGKGYTSIYHHLNSQPNILAFSFTILYFIGDSICGLN